VDSLSGCPLRSEETQRRVIGYFRFARIDERILDALLEYGVVCVLTSK